MSDRSYDQAPGPRHRSTAASLSSQAKTLARAESTQGLDQSPRLAAQRQLLQGLENSPRLVAQRRLSDAAFRPARQAPSHTNLPIQRLTILRGDSPVEVDDTYKLKHGERLPFDAEKRRQVIDTLGSARDKVPKPKVGINNRPGLGYDASVFSLEHDTVEPTSLPPGFNPLPYVAKGQEGYEASVLRAEREKMLVQSARDTGSVKDHLDGVSGLFLPGGQDRDPEGSPEKLTRQPYEQALVREARNRGMPTMAVCGGSRAFASAFGGREQELTKAQIKTHNQSTGSQAHGLTFPDPHTLLGGATPKIGMPAPDKLLGSATPIGTVDKINSTHKKVMASEGGKLIGVPDLPGTGRVVKRSESEGGDIVIPKESELLLSALDSTHGTPEGFETRYGAPMMGITSHPEAIYRGSTDRTSATPGAQDWSDRLFTGFEQSMRAYTGKQAVNEEIAPGWSAAVRARQAKPDAYAKWRGKRNWQKLQQLGMITEREAQEIRAEVAQHRKNKSDYFRAGRPGHERADPVG